MRQTEESIVREDEECAMTKPLIDSKKTALVLIDMQKGIMGMPLAPLSGDQIILSARALADHFRRLRAPVVLVNLAFPTEPSKSKTDVVLPMPPAMPNGWDELADGLEIQTSDIRLTKRGWGAFSSTDLDRKLKGLGVDTIVIGGVATNFGVEATAREAAALQYDVVFASDAVTTLSQQHQDFALQNIFPLIGRVRSSAEIIGS
jgi:nicotinamidase-related amidase